MRRSPTPLPPMAYRVAISGTLSLGATLTGSYIFSDPNAHAQGTSTFRWLRDGVAIGGATAITRVVAVADLGTSLVFEVTPVAATAPTTGVAARSDAVSISSNPERHHLPFNGTTNIARIVGGILGYTTQYAVVTKWATLPATPGCPINIVKSGLAFPNNITDSTQLEASSPNQHRHLGLTVAGGVSFNRATGGTGQCAGGQVHLMGRDNTANLARTVIVRATDQAIFWAPADAATSEDSTPDDIVIGGFPNADGSLNSGASNIQLVAVLAFWSLPADALLQAYAAPTCRDARPIFGSALKGYWSVSGMAGSSVPALVGSASMACTGLTAAQLVSW